MRRELYKLTKADRDIFERTPENPNLFTNWYFRGPNSGTFATPTTTDERYKALYKALMKRWLKLDKPVKFDFAYNYDEVPLTPFKAVTGQIFMRGLAMPTVSSPVYAKFIPNQKLPNFQVNHGFWLQDWQIDIMKLKQTSKVLIGGYGSSKTSISMIEMLINMAILPGFRGFCIAPVSMQSTAVYDGMLQKMEGTLYEQNFLYRNIRKQPQELGCRNDFTGETSVKFYSVRDDPDKIKNLEGDMAHIDQAEQLPDIPKVRGNISSRLRGNYQGRDRLGLIYYIANPNDNPQLWDLADGAEQDSDNTVFKQMASYDNWALTEAQIRKFERDVGATENERNSNLFGFRPVGDGKQFSGDSIKKCLSASLDERMKKGLEANTPGFIRKDAPRVGIYQWEIPPENDHTYIVMADPGQDNPPHRNAAVIGVWDITGFPGTPEVPVPAQLVAFQWVFSNNSPLPWMAAFFDYVERYKAIGRCGYDNTGWQSNYLQWVETFARVQSTGMNMNQSNKYGHLNSAKQLMNRGYLAYPTIQMLTSQLAKYDLPDDDIPQDIVVMIMLTCTWLNQYFYLNQRSDEHQITITPERHAWRSTQRSIGTRR